MKKEIFTRILSSFILIIISFFFIIKGNYYFFIFLILLMTLTLSEWYRMVFKKKFYYLGFLFIILSFLSAYLIRSDNNFGLINFYFILFICIGTDVGGYLFGNIFKGPKLTKISPNKTYTGSIGSFIIAIISVYILSIFINNIFEVKLAFDLALLTKILLLSLVSQIGDIIISYFKRSAKLKDTGNLIPGHGGILDRIDGLIFVCPFFYIVSLLNY